MPLKSRNGWYIPIQRMHYTNAQQELHQRVSPHKVSGAWTADSSIISRNTRNYTTAFITKLNPITSSSQIPDDDHQYDSTQCIALIIPTKFLTTQGNYEAGHFTVLRFPRKYFSSGFVNSLNGYGYLLIEPYNGENDYVTNSSYFNAPGLVEMSIFYKLKTPGNKLQFILQFDPGNGPIQVAARPITIGSSADRLLRTYAPITYGNYLPPIAFQSTVVKILNTIPNYLAWDPEDIPKIGVGLENSTTDGKWRLSVCTPSYGNNPCNVLSVIEHFDLSELPSTFRAGRRCVVIIVDRYLHAGLSGGSIANVPDTPANYSMNQINSFKSIIKNHLGMIHKDNPDNYLMINVGTIDMDGQSNQGHGYTLFTKDGYGYPLSKTYVDSSTTPPTTQHWKGLQKLKHVWTRRPTGMVFRTLNDALPSSVSQNLSKSYHFEPTWINEEIPFVHGGNRMEWIHPSSMPKDGMKYVYWHDSSKKILRLPVWMFELRKSNTHQYTMDFGNLDQATRDQIRYVTVTWPNDKQQHRPVPGLIIIPMKSWMSYGSDVFKKTVYLWKASMTGSGNNRTNKLVRTPINLKVTSNAPEGWGYGPISGNATSQWYYNLEYMKRWHWQPDISSNSFGLRNFLSGVKAIKRNDPVGQLQTDGASFANVITVGGDNTFYPSYFFYVSENWTADSNARSIGIKWKLEPFSAGQTPKFKFAFKLASRRADCLEQRGIDIVIGGPNFSNPRFKISMPMAGRTKHEGKTWWATQNVASAVSRVKITMRDNNGHLEVYALHNPDDDTTTGYQAPNQPDPWDFIHHSTTNLTHTEGVVRIYMRDTYDSSNTAGQYDMYLAELQRVQIPPPATTVDQPPTVTLNGSATVTVTQGSTWTDPGATAHDPEDGNLNVVVTGNVNTNVAGQYTKLYTATDHVGQHDQKFRTINVVQGNTPPVIHLNGSNPMYLHVGDTYNEPGAYATDAQDSPPPSVQILTSNVDTSIAHTVYVQYKATDSGGLSTTKTRSVIIQNVPNHAPTISLIGSAHITRFTDNPYVDQGATAYDTEDGTLPVTQTNNLPSPPTPGSYYIHYRATDSQGSTAHAYRYITYNQPIDHSISPGAYWTTSPISIQRTPVNKFKTKGSLLTIRVPCTISYGEDDEGGMMTSTIDDATTSSYPIGEKGIPATLVGVASVYVQYDNPNPSVSLSQEHRHGLVLNYSKADGTLKNAWYLIRYTGAQQKIILHISGNSKTGTSVSSKSKTSAWERSLLAINYSGCRKSIHHVVSDNTNIPSNPQRGHTYVVQSSSATTLYVDLAVSANTQLVHYFAGLMLPQKKDFSGINILRILPTSSINTPPNTVWYDDVAVLTRYDVNEFVLWMPTTQDHYEKLVCDYADYVEWSHTASQAMNLPACYDAPPTSDIGLSHWNLDRGSGSAPTNPPNNRWYLQISPTRNAWSVVLPNTFFSDLLDDHSMCYFTHNRNSSDYGSICKIPWLLQRAPGITFVPEGDAWPSGPANGKYIICIRPVMVSNVQKVDIYFKIRDHNGISHQGTSRHTIHVRSSSEGEIDSVPPWADQPDHVEHDQTGFRNVAMDVIQRSYDPSNALPNSDMITQTKITIWEEMNNTRMHIAIPNIFTTGDINRDADVFSIQYATGHLNEAQQAFGFMKQVNRCCIISDEQNVLTTSEVEDLMHTYVIGSVLFLRRAVCDWSVFIVVPDSSGNELNDRRVLQWPMNMGLDQYRAYPSALPESSYPTLNCEEFIDTQDCDHYCDKRLVPNVNNISKTNQVKINYDPDAQTLDITLVRGWLTSHNRDKQTMRVTYTDLEGMDNLLDRLDKVVMDARGTDTASSSSDLFMLPGNFAVGDTEVVFSRTNDDKLTLVVVEKRGDGVPVSWVFPQASATIVNANNGWVDEVAPVVDAYTHQRTDEPYGGSKRVETEDITLEEVHSDSTYFQKVPSENNFANLRVTFPGGILSTVGDADDVFWQFDIPSQLIIDSLEDMRLTTYVCLTNSWLGGNPNTIYPGPITEGSMVIAKYLSNKVEVYVRLNGAWVPMGVFEVVKTDIPMDQDPSDFTRPGCGEFFPPSLCPQGFIPNFDDLLLSPDLTLGALPGSEVTEVVGNWHLSTVYTDTSQMDEMHQSQANIQGSFNTSAAPHAEALVLSFKRRPLGRMSYFTTPSLFAPNRFFVYITDDPDVDTSGLIPRADPSKDIFYLAIPVRDVPSVTVHDRDGEVQDILLMDTLPEMTFAPNLLEVTSGSMEMKIAIVKNGATATAWFYENDRLIGRTPPDVGLPWIDSGYIGFHMHNVAEENVDYEEIISDIKLDYYSSVYDCLPPALIEANLGCDFAPSTAEQSIHTPMNVNVMEEIYRPLPHVVYGYVHIDVVNLSENAQVSIYKGPADGSSEPKLIKDHKNMDASDLVEFNNIRVVPGQRLLAKVSYGNVIIRCSSIEELTT